MLKEIANVLRNSESLECIKKAKTFEIDAAKTKTLNFRSLVLKAIDVVAIAEILAQEKDDNGDFIKSISFSYNQLIGDTGATVIAKSLPSSICEIGLVDCGYRWN